MNNKTKIEKENSKLEKELDNLEPLEVLDISELLHDYLVPVSIASKMKGISNAAIYDAIKRGKLRMITGITLSSLKGYKVSERNRASGKIGSLKKAKETLEEKDG